MKVHAAALKHGVSATNSSHAAQNPIWVDYLDEDSPARQLRIGFDVDGRLLETVVLVFDSGNELVIHAMKAREQTLRVLPAKLRNAIRRN